MGKGFREVADDSPGGREDHKDVEWGLGGIHIRERGEQRHTAGKQLAFVLREEGSLGFGVSAFLGEEQ